MQQEMLAKYARLVVRSGLNLQAGQVLVIGAPIECAPFARLVARTAYDEGARDVVINWRDELFTHLRFCHAPEEVFGEFPEWQKQMYLQYMRQGAAFLQISADDPELLKDVDPGRVMTSRKAANVALQEYRESLMSNKNVWTVVSVPTEAWARKVFPAVSTDAAMEGLWKAIFAAVRADTDNPVAAWAEHSAVLKRRLAWLNAQRFCRLEYRSSLGTELTVELPEGHIWLGGGEVSASGVEFIANMPTEEVFTLPKKHGVNGRVVSSKPLQYNGGLIEDFSLVFVDGKVTQWQARKGAGLLEKLLTADEGASYLGEVALVPYSSPISQSGILFYNTLFDENAACHLAFGKAYPVCLSGSDSMSKEELERCGVNDSLVHEDFMIGTEDLSIVGITASGERVEVFACGNFVIG